MGNFKKGGFGRGQGNRDFGGKKPGRDFGDRGQKQMFTAVCASCRKPCEVPFRPTGDKPVYCNDCFRNSRGEAPRPPRDDRFIERKFSTGDSVFVERKIDEAIKQLASLHQKIDLLIKVNGAGVENVGIKDKKKDTSEDKPVAKQAVAKKVVKKASAKNKIKTMAQK